MISPVARLALLPDDEVVLESLEFDPALVAVEETATEEDVSTDVEEATLETLEELKEDFEELLEDELVVVAVSVFLLKLWFRRKTPPKINRTAIIATITLALLDFCCILKSLI